MGLYERLTGNESNALRLERVKQNGTLHDHWLLLVRSTSAVLTVFLLAYLLANIPVYFTQLQTVCVNMLCPRWQLTTANARAIQNIGLSVSQYAIFSLSLSLFAALAWFAVAGFIVWRKSNDRMALLASLFLITQEVLQFTGSPSPPLEYSSPAWHVPTIFLLLLDSLLYLLVFSLFPNGRFVPNWMPWLVTAQFILGGIVLFLPSSFSSTGLLFTPLTTPLLLSTWAIIIGGQIYRYRRVSGPIERQQTKWIVSGLIVGPVVGVMYYFPPLVFPPLTESSSLYFLLFNPLFIIASLFTPLCFGIAILRTRLWDIDGILHRALMYAALSACVIGLYMLVVVGIGSLLQTQGNILLSLLATGLIALLFQPLRQRLQRLVNRLLYGERDDPYTVLVRLSRRLEATLVPETVLPTIVETVAQALKLPYVAIVLLPEQRPLPVPAVRTVGVRTEAGAEVPDIVTSYGKPIPDPVRVPLVYQTETIGYLLLAARAGELFGETDARLLADLARQAGAAVYAVRLSTHLQHLTEGLQQAREHLVTTREEERRRLRRDLHDGLGPQLSSQTLTLGAVRKLLRQNPDAADKLLADAITHAQEAITDIRRLIYALRPPALDDLGLLAALQEQLTQYRASGVSLVLDAPEQLPPLPAAVEVACYRIALEAVTNVVRHAHAQTCTLHLTLQTHLVLSICDDGQGLPPLCRSGVGLTSMRERAEELGGTCTITTQPDGGTCVLAHLPLS
jgi:signal transduction histidine kinase